MFLKTTMLTVKVSRKNSVTWQQAKEFIKKCPTCFLYNQTPLHTRSNSKGTNKVNKKMESGRQMCFSLQNLEA